MTEKTQNVRSLKVRLRSRTFIIIFAAVLSLSSAPEEKSECTVINPVATSKKGPWSVILDNRQVYNRGRAMGLISLPDGPPVKDDRAAYIMPFGSLMRSENLAKNRDYRIWFDFVRYREEGKVPFSSRLLIRFRNPVTGQEFRKEIGLTVLFKNSIYSVHLPRNITSHGVCEIFFREYSPVKGVWGIWDIHMCPGREFPRQ